MLTWISRLRSSYATLAAMTVFGLGVTNWRMELVNVPLRFDTDAGALAFGWGVSVPVLTLAGYATMVTAGRRRGAEPTRTGQPWPSLDGPTPAPTALQAIRLTFPPPVPPRSVRDLRTGSRLQRALRRLVFWSY